MVWGALRRCTLSVVAVVGVIFEIFLQDKKDGTECDEIVTEVVLRYRH